MKNYIILSGRPTFAPDWEEIGEKLGNLLILIANTSVYTQVLNKKQNNFFIKYIKQMIFP